MRVLVIMDDLSSAIPDKDTTIGFMLAAQKLGHTVDYAQISDLFIENGHGGVRARTVRLSLDDSPFYALEKVCVSELSSYDTIWMRKDPPVDRAYLHATHVLDLVGDKTLVVNSPAGVRFANEKLYALQFPHLCPDTLVTRSMKQIRERLDASDQPLIVKPVDGHGGAGVFLLRQHDRNISSILETLTDNEQRWVVAQEYLPEAREGDKRIIMINGESYGAILRIPKDDDNRGNIHVGGRVVDCELTPRDRLICETVGPRLREDGLWFVGLDVIGGKLTEINVTSPTGIREIQDLTGRDVGQEYVRWVQNKIKC